MKGTIRFASIAATLAFGLGLAGTSALRGQDATTAASVVPRLIKFSGVLTSPGTQNRISSASAPVINATFSLYEFQEGGSPLWSESQQVQLDGQSRYVVLLGATDPAGLPLDLFTSGKALWLGVQPQLSGAGELPRVLLVAVPCALKASDSDTLGGKPASAYALAGAPTVVELAGGPALPSASPNKVQPDIQTVNKDSSLQPLTPCAAVTSNGAATINTLAKFTAACTIQNSLLRDNGTGVAVGGTASPGALFDVQFTSTAATGALLGQRVLTTLNPAAASSVTANGFFANALTQSGNAQNFTGKIFALNSELDHYGTGTLSNGYGMNGTLINKATGTITNAYGINATLWNASTGQITNGYGVYVSAPANATGGTFSNFTGLYIANPSAVAGAYGLYSAGGKNYFGGNVGIATTTPAATLEVNGTAKFDGLITFKSGQTFPIPAAGVTDAMLANPYSGVGTCTSGKVVSALTRNAAPTCLTLSMGTVTSVASGSGLTGGPITASGTLSIASAGVTDSMLANGYSGTGACGPGQVVTTLTRNAAPTCITVGTGTVTSVASGSGLTGGPITGTGTLSIAGAGVTDAMLANAYSGTGACGTGKVVTTLARNAAPTCLTLNNTYAQLGAMNTFTMTQTIANGDLSLPNTTSGTSGVITLGGTPFMHECCSNPSNPGYSNTFVGPLAGNFSSSGGANTGIGFEALISDAAGSENSAIGFRALGANNAGSFNTAFGYAAGINNAETLPATGSNSTFIGAYASATVDGLTNATAIGYNAQVSASNALVLGPTQDGNGNPLTTSVGIGTSSPAALLDVEGGTNAAANQNGVAGLQLVAQAGGGNNTAGGIAGEGGTIELTGGAGGLDNSGSGAGGHGGDVSITAGNGGVGYFCCEDPGGVWITGGNGGTNATNTNPINGGSIYLQGGQAGTGGTYGNIILVANGGHVGIGTGFPDNLLTVNGTADKPGGGSWGTFSDRRLKTVDGAFQSGLSQVLNLKPVRYRYNDDNALGIHDPGEHIGVVAQEVQKVIPEAVTANSRGYLIVNNDPIIWSMLNAIKEQHILIRNQQQQAQIQQRVIAKLKSEIAKQRKQAEAQQAAMKQLLAQVQEIQVSLSSGRPGRPHRQVASASAYHTTKPELKHPSNQSAPPLVAKVRF